MGAGAEAADACRVTCFHPITGRRDQAGIVRFDGKGFIDRPVTVSCGRCWGCRLEKSRQWAVRCLHETQLHEDNCFITLTYDDEHLPANGSVDVEEWKCFAKKLRHFWWRDKPKAERRRIRYFHCGEYGDSFGRPHYHAILFGVDFRADQRKIGQKRGVPLYSSELLEQLWGQGNVTVGAATFESAAYVARYIMKKITGHDAIEHYGVDCDTGEVLRKPEYVTMSRGHGIGSKWIEKYHKEVYLKDSVIIRGKRQRPPKFYDSQFELLNPKQMEIVKGKRIEEAGRRRDDNTWERLEVREEVQRAGMSLYKRGG